MHRESKETDLRKTIREYVIPTIQRWPRKAAPSVMAERLGSIPIWIVRRGVEQLEACQAHYLEVAGSSPVPATSAQKQKIVAHKK